MCFRKPLVECIALSLIWLNIRILNDDLKVVAHPLIA